MKDNNPINFIVVGRARLPFETKPNTCYLMKDNWDDFGFKTCFHLTYSDSNSATVELGILRIITKEQQSGRPEMPEGWFSELSDIYCSVGNEQGYYEELMGLEKEVRKNILISLRDCAFNNTIYESHKNEDAMSKSLFRSVDVQKITQLFPSILSGNIKLTPYHFQYSLDGNKDTQIDVKVTPYSNPPSNVHVLIGRNAVGKTRILSGIVDSLIENNTPHSISQKGKLVFVESYSHHEVSTENFFKLVTVVFSAFDHFMPVRNNSSGERMSCHYIGLKTEEGDRFKTLEDLKNDFIKSVKVCLKGQRRTRWIESIGTLNSDPIFKEYALNEAVDSDEVYVKLEELFDYLSSGHKIILLTITKLVELVDEKTLVLIDEPENHLHPPLLSSFIRAVSDLLIKRNAVALIATHSPVILQEVPRKCVTKIDRVGGVYHLCRPNIETYGENIDTLRCASEDPYSIIFYEFYRKLFCR